jgi:DNA invertase Pin-like site-specific DNA recombinase
MSTIYGYIRVSTKGQAEHGMGLQAQLDAIKAYTSTLAKRTECKIGKVYREPGVSASKRNFAARPVALDLLQKVKRGDHVVIAKLDRGFRNTIDCLSTLKRWQVQGVTAHLLDISVDTSTAMGQLLVGILAVIAEWESARRSERIIDAIEASRQRYPNRSLNAQRVIGYQIDGDKLIPHSEERAAGDIAAKLRSQGLALSAIAEQLGKQSYARPGGKPWNPASIKRIIQRARAGWPINPYIKERETHGQFKR